MADAVPASATVLNADARSGRLDLAALDAAVRAQGADVHDALAVGHPHLFATVPLFVTASELREMKEVVAAVEQTVKQPGWQMPAETAPFFTRGVFYGYDFHLNDQGVHLIEINTNAGGGFLNALLLDSQRDADLPGEAVASKDIWQDFIEMFRSEWRSARGDVPLKTVAIVDEQPVSQYLFPEFLLAQHMFERAGIKAYIADPAAFEMLGDGLYLDGCRIDLVYNRLTDFLLQQHYVLRQAYLGGKVVLTPDPCHYARYADKRNLARLTDGNGLRALGLHEDDIAVLQAGVPNTQVVRPEMEDVLWAERKHWFFKPNTGYGSKGAYRGEKLTRRVFGEILQSGYVAQKMAVPGERAVSVGDGEPLMLKYDVRCYVYDAQVQLVTARLYQGQTTNFRTPGGGFAPVRVVGQ